MFTISAKLRMLFGVVETLSPFFAFLSILSESLLLYVQSESLCGCKCE